MTNYSVYSFLKIGEYNIVKEWDIRDLILDKFLGSRDK